MPCDAEQVQQQKCGKQPARSLTQQHWSCLCTRTNAVKKGIIDHHSRGNENERAGTHLAGFSDVRHVDQLPWRVVVKS